MRNLKTVRGGTSKCIGGGGLKVGRRDSFEPLPSPIVPGGGSNTIVRVSFNGLNYTSRVQMSNEVGNKEVVEI